jgi:hypothetical protein
MIRNPKAIHHILDDEIEERSINMKNSFNFARVTSLILRRISLIKFDP